MMYVLIVVCSVTAPACSVQNADVLARIRVPNEEMCREVAMAVARVATQAFPNDKLQFNCAREDDA